MYTCECGGELETMSDENGRTVGKCQECELLYYIDE